MSRCVVCGRGLVTLGTGRPPAYCSIEHRRRAQAERDALPVMRANLEHLQEMSRRYPRDLMGWGRLAREAEAGIARIEARSPDALHEEVAS